MRRGHKTGMRPLTAGLIALVVIVVGCYFGFTKANPFAKTFEMSAAFKTVNDLKPNSPVRIAGVNVGKVTKIETVTDDPTGAGAIVTMELQDKGLPIHQDAEMKVRPRIFLEGNYFLDVNPGSPSSPAVEEGDMIPVQQTSAPVQFGQVLTALQSDTRKDLQVVLDEYGRALANGGAKGYNRSIKYWPRAFRDSAIVNEAMLGTEEHDLTNYIRGADKFARGLNRDPEALKALVRDFATTGQALAAERDALARAIDELPDTLTVGHRAMGELNLAFPPLRRLVADLRPAVRSSGPALDALYPTLKQLRGLVSQRELGGLVKDLKPLIPELIELNVGGVGLQEQLRLASSCANEVLIPWRNDQIQDEAHPTDDQVFKEQVKWLPGIAAESRSFDANGQYVRTIANGANYAYPLNDGRIFLTGLPILGVNPPRQATPPPLRSDVACETQQPPDLRTKPGAPPRAVKVDNTSAAARALWAKERPEAVKYLEEQLRRAGIKPNIAPQDLRADQVPQLGKAKVAKP